MGSAIDQGGIITAMKHFVIPALEKMNDQGVYHGDILNHKMKVNYTNILTNGRDYRLIDFGPTGTTWIDNPRLPTRKNSEEAMSPETTVEELKAEKERVAIWKKAHSSERTEPKHFIPPPTPARKKRRAKDDYSTDFREATFLKTFHIIFFYLYYLYILDYYTVPLYVPRSRSIA